MLPAAPPPRSAAAAARLGLSSA